MYTNLSVTDLGEVENPVTADLIFGIKAVTADEFLTEGDAVAYYEKVAVGDEVISGIPSGVEFEYVIIPGTGPLILYVLYGAYIKAIMMMMRMMH